MINLNALKHNVDSEIEASKMESEDTFRCTLGLAELVSEGLSQAISLIGNLTEENTELKANWQKLKDDYDNNDSEWRKMWEDTQTKWDEAYDVLEAEKEHLEIVVEGKLKRISSLEKMVLKLTEENERLKKEHDQI